MTFLAFELLGTDIVLVNTKFKDESCELHVKMSRRNRNRSQGASLDVSSQSQTSQPSQSSRRGTQRTVSPPDEDFDEYTVATLKFILNHMATKHPIKRADIVKECCNGNTKTFIAILSTVQNHLKSVSFQYLYNTNYLFK